MYMWNIRTDSYQAVMADQNWVATPMCLNYGYFRHGFQDKYMSYVYDDVYKQFFYFNNFGQTKEEVIADIKQWATGSTYAVSLNLGDVSSMFRNVETYNYNVAHVLLSDEQIKIAIAWVHANQKPKLIDYKLLHVANINANDTLLEYLYSTRKDKIIATFCAKMFKNTVKMYGSKCVLRFMVEPMQNCADSGNSQYVGRLRIDSGKNPETGRFDKFSVIKSMEYSEEMAVKQMEYVNLCRLVRPV